ncbi:esterase/lipase family protein [Arthrobacter sp. D3-16]
MTQFLPIIYVRGFAGGTQAIDKAADDPFYGFNEGSTHVRIGAHGNPHFYQFESPLLRLMIDYKYELKVDGNQQRLLQEAASGTLPARTIWVYRFYDSSASTFGKPPTPYRIEEAAKGLADYISQVLDKTRDADQVYLVAHSMGGLVCRSAIQRFMYQPNRTPTPDQIIAGAGSVHDPSDRAAPSRRQSALRRLLSWILPGAEAQHEPGAGTKAKPPNPARRKGHQPGSAPGAFPVSKVVTYGTPHGGIDIDLGGSVGDWVMETFGPNGSDIFKEPRMREYLCPEGMESFEPQGGWDSRVPYFSALPAERFLSLVGTNPGDYDVALGWSSRAVGVKSDGLVQIRNAYVKGSNRAYIHRSHSGRYGLVNSEEGYQNLQRFLFGNIKIVLNFSGLDLDTSNETVWQADVALAIRKVPVLMHYQSARTHCPVVLSEENRDAPLNPVPLVTAFLLPKPTAGPRRYTLDLRVFAVREEGGFLSFGSHFEQVADWQDTLLMDVYTEPDGTVQKALYQWNSTIEGPIAEAGPLKKQLSWAKAPEHTKMAPNWAARIDFPPVASKILGKKAHLDMRIAPWE